MINSQCPVLGLRTLNAAAQNVSQHSSPRVLGTCGSHTWVYISHLEGLLKQIAESTSPQSLLFNGFEGGPKEFMFLPSSQIMHLPVRIHFENYCFAVFLADPNWFYPVSMGRSERGYCLSFILAEYFTSNEI